MELVSYSKPKRNKKYWNALILGTDYSIEAMGATKAEAEANLYQMVKETLRGRYCPYVVSWRSLTAIVWREPHGPNMYFWGLLRQDRYRPDGTCGCETFDRAERSARMSLAQLEWDGTETTSEVITNDEDAAEFASWVTFQLRYKEGIAKGMTDAEAHEYGCGLIR